MTTHSEFAASKAHQWLNCPGSIWMARKYPPAETSEYAAEGTLAHAVSHDHILTDHVVKGVGIEKAITNHLDKCSDDEMRQCVADYCRIIAQIIAAVKPKNVALEKRFILDEALGIGGTADVAFVAEVRGERLGCIIDLKYGQGVAVDADDNPQLATYAAAMHTDREWGNLDKCIVYIYQPRAEHSDGALRSMRLSAINLSAWMIRLRERAKIAKAQADAGKPDFCPGEHCRWCPGEAVCAAKARWLSAEAAVIFPTEAPPAPEVVLSDEQRARIVLHRAAFENFLKAVEDSVVNDMRAGRAFPGLKLVRGRSNRQWRLGDAEIAKELSARGIEKPWKASPLIGIPEAEKILGKGKVDDLVEKPEGPLKAAPESDKRPAVAAAAIEAQGAFKE